MTQKQQDEKDMKAIAAAYLLTMRCKGGRLINRDYICLHCKSSNPEDECNQPITVKKVAL